MIIFFGSQTFSVMESKCTIFQNMYVKIYRLIVFPFFLATMHMKLCGRGTQMIAIYRHHSSALFNLNANDKINCMHYEHILQMIISMSLTSLNDLHSTKTS